MVRDLRCLLPISSDRCRKKCSGDDQEVPALDAAHAFLSPRKTAGKPTLDELLWSILPSNDRSQRVRRMAAHGRWQT
jgi:hypothetical protein